MAKIIATWDISLNCDCPECREYVDLLAYTDFWNGRGDMTPVEHGTDRTRDMEVVCPECNHVFEVDCEY